MLAGVIVLSWPRAAWIKKAREGSSRIASRELTYPTWGSLENHLQNAIFGGYVNSLEGSGLLQVWLSFFPSFFFVCLDTRHQGVLSPKRLSCRFKAWWFVRAHKQSEGNMEFWVPSTSEPQKKLQFQSSLKSLCHFLSGSHVFSYFLWFCYYCY